jgi:hypothetical protein
LIAAGTMLMKSFIGCHNGGVIHKEYKGTS